jgi:hypothetical protein
MRRVRARRAARRGWTVAVMAGKPAAATEALA